jgi:hypothetical protein
LASKIEAVKPVRDDAKPQIRQKYQGQKELQNYLSGDKLSPKKAILAKCYECLGFYRDGAYNCKMKDCPLYPFMPYSRPAQIPLKTLSKESMGKQ